MDKRQITGVITGKPSKHPFPQHMQIARRIAAEGMVVLRNENRLLPLKPGKLALFGSGATDTVTCGTGSGYVYAPYTVNIRQGLCNAGFTLTSNAWLNRFEAASKKANKEDKTLSRIDRMWSGVKILIDDLPISEQELSEAAQADTALYVLRRNAGECADRKHEKGDYLLSDIEQRNLTCLTQRFSHVILVLNTCVVDASFFAAHPGIQAVLLMGYSGNEAGNALADALTGKVTPSGRLTDTWAMQYKDYPASTTFGDNDGNSQQEDYTEGIYVGYRYFQSFGVDAAWPFGYGLGYSDFSMELKQARADWNEITLTVTVKNTGAFPDREVVQVYVSAPEDKLVKPYQELKCFQKTSTLKPGGEETLILHIPTQSLASYETESASFVMEAGRYLLRIGKNSRDAAVMAALDLQGKATVRYVHDCLKPDHPLDTIHAPAQSRACPANIPVLTLNAADCVAADETHDSAPYSPAQPKNVTLAEVSQEKATLREFVASLEEEVLFRLVAGIGSETPYKAAPRGSTRFKKVKAPSSSGATTALFTESLGIPAWYMTDGPAGAHIPFCGATCWPVGMVLAQTWDIASLEEMGAALAKELDYYNYSVLLGPGMNIHRDPLCGRNFEYFSEDPLLSGKAAAAITRGIQRVPGVSVSVKHFCCNNQEANRATENNTVSQRALREIYLRGFEICVREADPHTVMTSYNLVNGCHTSSSSELLRSVLRDEWGFRGMVMTDWGSTSNKVADLNAGNNLIMGGYRSQFFKAAYEGQEPVFADDGYVKVDHFKVYGGFMTENVENWNTFTPEKGGPDQVSTAVAAGKALNPKVQEYVDAGVAAVTDTPEVGKLITYAGTKQGKTLSRAILEENALGVLQQILNSVSFRRMMGK